MSETDPLAASIASDNPEYPFGVVGPSLAELRAASLEVRLAPLRDQIETFRRSLPWYMRVLWRPMLLVSRVWVRIRAVGDCL